MPDKIYKKTKLICGVGINDADYNTQFIINGKTKCCNFYSIWSSMIRRCYSKYKQETDPSYIGCKVHSEWLTFSNFKSWMIKQDWQGKAIDKDILVQGNKVYSPSTCIFVTTSINNLLITHKSRKRQYPIGVFFIKSTGRYRSSCQFYGKTKFLGYYDTPEEAHEAYKKFKYNHIAEIANQQSEPLRTALLNYVIEG
jgi:hypothetical protein